MPALICQEVWQQPFTALIAIFLAVVYILLQTRQNYGSEIVDLLSFQYQKIVDHKQYYRLVTSNLLHGNVLHLALNVSTLWSLYVEKLVGALSYFQLTLLLLCLCGLTHLFLIRILQNISTPARITSELNGTSIGYSGVVFALSAIAIFASPNAIHSIPVLGITIPRLLVPVFNLVVTHFLIPNASFLGHFSGIIVGFAIGLVHSSTPIDTFLGQFWALPFLLGAIFYLLSTYPHRILLWSELLNKISSFWSALGCSPFCGRASPTIVNGIITPSNSTNADNVA